MTKKLLLIGITGILTVSVGTGLAFARPTIQGNIHPAGIHAPGPRPFTAPRASFVPRSHRHGIPVTVGFDFGFYDYNYIPEYYVVEPEPVVYYAPPAYPVYTYYYGDDFYPYYLPRRAPAYRNTPYRGPAGVGIHRGPAPYQGAARFGGSNPFSGQARPFGNHQVPRR